MAWFLPLGFFAKLLATFVILGTGCAGSVVGEGKQETTMWKMHLRALPGTGGITDPWERTNKKTEIREGEKWEQRKKKREQERKENKGE